MTYPNLKYKLPKLSSKFGGKDYIIRIRKLTNQAPFIPCIICATPHFEDSLASSCTDFPLPHHIVINTPCLCSCFLGWWALHVASGSGALLWGLPALCLQCRHRGLRAVLVRGLCRQCQQLYNRGGVHRGLPGSTR